MRNILLCAGLLVALLCCPGQARPNSLGRTRQQLPQSAQEFQAVAELAQRVAPWLAPHLTLQRIPAERGDSIFELETKSGRLILRASDSPSAAMGLHWYLKYYCHRSISHLGDNMAPVEPLPRLPHLVRRSSRFKYRYYLNYCTLNYSFAFAGWNRWEREIDWMALNGINLALATNGTEAIWQNTLRRMGYTDSEILQFLPGPAYTAWWLMGNLEGWGGPLSQRMIDGRTELQKKILARMRELGIEPVLQGFYGMVPLSLAQKFPAAHIVSQGQWSSFRRPMILLSSDTLFARLASVFYEETGKLYGPARFFGGDLFHEGGQTEGLDIGAVARGVQDSMLRVNPDAVWVLQGWQENPRDELLNGLLRDHILVLNLGSQDWEKRKGFNGSPWVWGIINNFGENTGMFGDLPRIASEPVRAADGPYGRTIVGIGALMEGINNNPVVYDLLFEMAWRDQPVDLHRWIPEYVRYRYGNTTPELEHAWQLLTETVYSSGYGPQSIFCARPSLQVKGASTWGSTQFGYDPAKLEEAARELLGAGDKFSGVDAYQADAVDLARQVLANRGLILYRRLVSAYQIGDKAQFNQMTNAFLRLLRDQDALVGARREFLLGRWLDEAKAMGQTEAEQALCEKNARTQVTYWGPDDPDTDVHDYANKEWSGLLLDFYLPRWEMFIRELNSHLNGRTATEIHYFDFERDWTQQHKLYPASPSGNPVATARELLSRSSGASQP